ncbi:MAG: pentapeptide repeat-containing protein [Pseudomonadota bacterium]|nr:pentapeptide repeat-containing protein [Pseudomonadota bacterium]
MVDIKRKGTGEIIAMVGADSLVGADLTELDLRGADLREMNLQRANF